MISKEQSKFLIERLKKAQISNPYSQGIFGNVGFALDAEKVFNIIEEASFTPPEKGYQVTSEGRYLYLLPFDFADYPNLVCELKLHAPGIPKLSMDYLTIRLTHYCLEELRNHCNDMIEYLKIRDRHENN